MAKVQNTPMKGLFLKSISSFMHIIAESSAR
jgi:hypothetical protein